MQFNLEEMKAAVLRIADPSDKYSQEDFNKEFGGNPLSDSPDYYKLNFKFANKSNNPDPEYATNGSSGFDLRASLNAPMTIHANTVGVVPTGLFFEIPQNFEIQIRPRSGLAAKNSVTVLNSPGTIDADYRGEIKVILINHSEFDFQIVNGDRIAQAVVASVMAKNIVNLVKVSDISVDTERGVGGFGSTGLK